MREMNENEREKTKYKRITGGRSKGKEKKSENKLKILRTHVPSFGIPKIF